MLGWWEAVFLGFIQGLTEFLPVSSSGHLAIAEYFLGIKTGLSFDIFVHLGTLVAVTLYFWRDLIREYKTLWLPLVVATIPAVVVGFFTKDWIEQIRLDMLALSVCYALTALLLGISAVLLQTTPREGRLSKAFASMRNWLDSKRNVYDHPTLLQAFLVGIFQALALLPSVSRSGSAVSGGLIVGLKPETAFRFAFLISIPAIGGAILLDVFELFQSGEAMSIPWPQYILATVVSGVVGFGALALLQWFMQKRLIWPFAVYCLVVSVLLLFFV